MIGLNKKNMAKLFAAAAAVGTAAAATAVIVNRRKKKQQHEEMKRLPKGKNIYFIGNSVSAMLGAAYLIHDFGFRGENIHIYGKYALDGCGNSEDGLVCYDTSFIANEYSECLFDVLKNVPSGAIGDISVKTEIENYNNAYPLSATGRLADADHDYVSGADKKQLIRLLKTNPDPTMTVGDLFGADFFDSDFYALWQSLLGLARDTSAAEFGKTLRELLFLSPAAETCEGVLDTCLNQYESIELPLREYLKSCGVEFCEDVVVTDLEFDEENKNISAFHIVDRETRKIFYMNQGDLCIMTPCTVYEGMTEGGFDMPAPVYSGEKLSLWKKLNEKQDGLGRPEALAEVPEILFTATLSKDILSSRIFDMTLNSPGTLLTFKNSKWDLSIVCPMGQYFSQQKEDVFVIKGRILNCAIEGNHVKKQAIHASGAEILYELVGLLGLQDEWEEIRESVVNVVPVLLPYGGSAAAARNAEALPEMFPNNSKNFAIIGEFVKTDCARGGLEMEAAVAKQAVYGLFGKDPKLVKRKLPAFPRLRLNLKYGKQI